MFCGSAELCASAGAVCVFEAFLAIYRPGRGHDHHVGRDRGSRGLDRDPSGGRAQRGRVLPPSTPQYCKVFYSQQREELRALYPLPRKKKAIDDQAVYRFELAGGGWL